MTNHEQLFGTPEMTARVLMSLQRCRVVGCEYCIARDVCMPHSYFTNEQECVEWLESEVGR